MYHSEKAPYWQTVENEWNDFTRLDHVTSETCERVFSTDYECFKLAWFIESIFHRGITKLAVVLDDGSLCGRRVFSMDGDCVRVAHLILAIGHTRD